MAVSERTTYAPESDLLSAESADERLAEQFAPCFTLILKLRSSDEFGDPEVLRRRIKDLLDRTEREALRTGVSPDDIQAAKFALVAFIDETILSSDWSRKDEWMNTPLQLDLYDRYDAGEAFFDRLDAFLDEARAHAEVLEIYYLCMALGFKGKYQIHEQEQLREIIETTSDTLSKLRGSNAGELAPHGEPRGQVATEVRSKVPAWVIAAAAALVGVLIYMGMYLYASSTAQEVAESIGQMGPG